MLFDHFTNNTFLLLGEISCESYSPNNNINKC